MLFGLWIASIISFVVLGAGEIRSHSITATKTEMHALPISNLDTLTVSLYKTGNISSDWEFKKNNPLNRLIDRIEDEQDLVKLSIQRSPEANSSLEIKASAKGSSQEKAQDNVGKLEYKWEVNNKTLYLNPMVTGQNLNGFQTKKVELILNLSEGQILSLNTNLKSILNYPVKNNQSYSSRRTAGYLWKMGADELECLNCPQTKSKLQLHYQDTEGEEKLHLKVDKDGIQLKKK